MVAGVPGDGTIAAIIQSQQPCVTSITGVINSDNQTTAQHLRLARCKTRQHLLDTKDNKIKQTEKNKMTLARGGGWSHHPHSAGSTRGLLRIPAGRSTTATCCGQQVRTRQAAAQLSATSCRCNNLNDIQRKSSEL